MANFIPWADVESSDDYSMASEVQKSAIKSRWEKDFGGVKQPESVSQSEPAPQQQPKPYVEWDDVAESPQYKGAGLIDKGRIKARHEEEFGGESGVIAGTGKALVRGIADVGVQAGNYLEFNKDYLASGDTPETRDESKLGIVEKTGRAISDVSEKAKGMIPKPDYDESEGKRWLFEGVESLPPSAAYTIPATAGAMGGRALGAGLGAVTGPGAVATSLAGGALGAAIAQAATSRVMYGSVFQQTMEELDKAQAQGLLKDGITQEDKMRVAHEAGQAEWQGEAPSSIIEALIFSKIPAGKTLSAILKPGLTQFGKNVAMSAPAELGGEAWTSYRQAAAQNEVLREGAQSDPGQEAIDVLGPTAVMTTLMGGLGLGVQRLRSTPLARALEDAEADPVERAKAVGQAAQIIESQHGTAAAEQFRLYASDEVANGRAIDLTVDLTAAVPQVGQAQDDLAITDPAEPVLDPAAVTAPPVVGQSAVVAPTFGEEIPPPSDADLPPDISPGGPAAPPPPTAPPTAPAGPVSKAAAGAGLSTAPEQQSPPATPKTPGATVANAAAAGGAAQGAGAVPPGIDPNTGEILDPSKFATGDKAAPLSDAELEEVFGEAEREVAAASGNADDSSLAPIAPKKNAERYAVVDNPESVADLQTVNVEPSEAQKAAGNYQKGHVKLDGLDISIENPVGSVRTGKDASGREWQSEMAADYGYFKGTKGKDKDHIDVFIKPGYQGGGKDVYVVNQYNADGTFDEHKTVLGATSEEEAMAIYNSNYEAGWTGGKEVTRLPVDQFKMWSRGAGPSKGALLGNRTVKFGGEQDAESADRDRKTDARGGGEEVGDAYGQPSRGTTVGDAGLGERADDAGASQGDGGVAGRASATVSDDGGGRKADADTSDQVQVDTNTNNRENKHPGPDQSGVDKRPWLTKSKDRATAEVVGGSMQGIAEKVKSAPGEISPLQNIDKTKQGDTDGEISPDIVKSVKAADVPGAQAVTAPPQGEASQDVKESSTTQTKLWSKTLGEYLEENGIDPMSNRRSDKKDDLIKVHWDAVLAAYESGENIPQKVKDDYPRLGRLERKKAMEGKAPQNLGGESTKALPAPPPTTTEGWQKNPLKARVLAKKLGISVSGKDGKPLRGEDVIAAVRNHYANQVEAPVIAGMWDGHPDTEQDRKKIKAAQSERTNAAMAWLQLNETVMALAELQDKAGYVSTAESELAEWLSQTKEQADKSHDKIMSAAIDYLLGDGKVTLPAKFFDAAYKSAVAKVKQEGVERAIRRATEQLEESVQGKGLSGVAAENFREGWNHAISGKSRSSLRLNDDITAGYDAARDFLKTPQGKNLFQKAQKKKLEGTGADLVRAMDKKRKEIEATENTEAIVKKLMAATKRADLFKGISSDDATPGAQKLLSLFRDYFYTFGDYLTARGKRDGLLRETYGEYLGRGVSAEDKIKAYLDLRVNRHDGSKTHEDETKEERVELLKNHAEDYVTAILEITSQVRGENVKDLAISITDAIVKPDQAKGGKGSKWVVPDYRSDSYLVPTLSAIATSSGMGRNLLVRVDGEGNVAEAGYTVEQLLKRESDESLKRKTGTPLMPPKFDRVTRKGGRDYRQGRDVTPEEFKETFGFIDVGFGDYVAAQEDQDHLNYAYDAFMDLAHILGLPPKAMSIAGRLYFSIGNLGHGKAAAHYNAAHPHPKGGTVPVINVTNTQGDGTVSHEWAHAFDLTTPNMQWVFYQVREALKKTLNWQSINDTVTRMLKGESFWKGDKKTDTKQQRIDNALRVYDYYNNSRMRSRTKFLKDALALDGVKDSTKDPYWSNDKEILARSFEAWVADKLDAAGSKNTYLVNPEWVGDGKITPEKGFRGTPYPAGEERKLFNKFYDAMVEALVVDDKTGEATLDENLFRKKAPNLALENLEKWEAMVAEMPQRADDLEREVMAQKKEENDRADTAKIMKGGDIIEPRENAEAVAERLKVNFPTMVVGMVGSETEHWRQVKMIDNIGAEVSAYARDFRIVIPAEDVTKLLDTADLPAEATANTSSELSDADLESIFDEALNEVQESTQEKPDEPPPGADIAADLKVGMWTREDIQEIRDMIEGGKIIMVGDKDLGIPTIHDWPSDKTKHHGFGAFTTETDEYKVDWDGGGMMQKTVGGRSYTRVNVHRGTIPFYDKEAILAHLDGLVGVKKKEAIEAAQQGEKSKVQLHFDALMAGGPGAEGYVLAQGGRPQKKGGQTWIFVHGGIGRNFPADGVVWTKEQAAARALLEIGHSEEDVAAVVFKSRTTTPQKTPTAPPSLDAEQQKTVKNLAAEALKLGVEGIDEAMTGLVKLFGGGKSTLMSFPAGLDEDTYRQAKPHFSEALKKFQAAGQSLKDLFVFLIKNFGAGIKPYALRFAKDEGLTRDLGDKASASKQVAEFIAERLTKGQQTSWQELFAKADEAWGGTQAENTYTSRDAYDAMEMGVNLWLRRNKDFTINQDAENAASMVRGLTHVISKLPTQTKRTKEQEQFQQFSTPPALAYVANWVAKVGPRDVMMEPSAGTGDLAIWSEKAGASLILNELSSRRAGLLRELFPNAHILTEDGLQLNNILAPNVQASVVVMNPPFSSTAGRTDRNDTMNGAKHLEQALKRLAPGGRLVAIVGEGMGASKPAFLKWWKDIQSKYTVRANISISGAEYAKYGTTFDNQIVVIDNTGKTTTDPVTVRVDSVADLPQILEGIRNERQEVTEYAPPQRTGLEDTEQGKDTVPSDRLDANLDPDAMDPGGRGPGGTTADDGGREQLPGEVPGSGRGGAGSGSTQSGGATGSDRGSRRGGIPGSGTPGGAGSGRDGAATPGGTELRDGTTPGEISVDDVQTKREGELTDAIFEAYKPQRLSIPGAKEHPGPLVQSAAMASVEPPAPTYTPNLPKEVISKGLLSLPQLEAVVYAGQAHSELLPDGRRRGFFIGDNTGVGKGREISGIILDNLRQGRKKAVWVSASAGLIDDARRDFGGIGGDPKAIFATPGSPNAPITQKDGILFITYDTLKTEERQKGATKSRSRIDQLLEWLGPDYDGVIAFDEAHGMGNATPMAGVRGRSKPSQKALTGVKLQNQAKNARVVYVSATGATEVKNLSYATRLGLWGENTPFANVVGFVSNIVSGGVAAMEMVARDMKALGSYIARSLSFDGVQYRTLRHNLSAMNVAKYDELAKMWQVVLKDINKALADTGGEKSSAKKNAMGAFWGAQQRFFNQILTAMQTPAMIEDAKQQLADGKSVVVQLTNHYAGQAEREVAQAREEGRDLEELDLTPRQMLDQFLRNSFPTQQYEEQTDDAGNVVMVPVLDSQGNPVHNADAVAARDKLLETLSQITIPGNPIDTIIEELGKENVAEITGRNKRYLTVRDGKGGYKVVEEKRGKSSSKKEAAEFQEGKRRVLIFSGAGATGFSFHADNTAKNKQQRIHYVLQPGWRADTAVQGFGRTHRTNQASAPEYVLVSTDVQAQKRFVSSIARRLDQLGALTKGQRETSGGLFNASDNLESKYGQAALVALFTNMANGYTNMNFDEVIGEMGLSNLKGEQGQFLPNNIPEMTKFLNRLLSLTVDRQNEVFGTFFQYLDEIVNRAIEQGTYDTGLQTIKAQSIEKTRDEVVFTDQRTGAKTRFVEANISNPVRFRDFEEAQRWAKSRGEKFVGWFSGPRSKIFGLVDLGERLDKDGNVFNRGEVVGIVDGSVRHVDNVLTIRRESRKNDGTYRKIEDIEEVRQAWEKAVEEAPKISTYKEHMLVGVLMPIWDRIVGSPKIYRMQTDAGEVLLGRTMSGKDLQQTMRNLGVGSDLSGMGPQEMLASIRGGATAVLANGWNIKQRMVSGENRVEVMKGAGRDFTDSEIAILKGKGAFHEVISWKDRVFIPQGQNATKVFESITKANPVVDLEGGAGPAGEQESTMFSSTALPLNQQADTPAELRAKLGKGYDALTESGKLRVVATQKDAQRIIDMIRGGVDVKYSADGKTIEGFAAKGVSYLVEDGIVTGKAWPTLVHELGTHINKLMLADPEFKMLVKSMEKRRAEKTPDGVLIAKAFAAVPEDTKAEHINEEALAYLIANHPEVGIVRRIIAMVKRLLVKAGFKDVSIFTPADLRAIAEAAVRSEAKTAKQDQRADGRGMAPVMMSQQQAARSIFSKLEQVAKMQFIGMKAQSVVPFLQKHGVKKAEIDAVGLESWLRSKSQAPFDPLRLLMGKGEAPNLTKITRDDLMNFVQANMVDVEDVVLGESGVDLSGDLHVGETDEGWGVFTEYGEGPIGGLFEAEEEAEQAMLDIDSMGGATHFSDYTEPGADPGSYREMFVTAPNIGTADEKANLTEPLWVDGHAQYAGIKNPVVRVRFNTETRDGKTYLRIEEMQGPSDAYQKQMPAYLRENIYNIGSKRVIAMAKEMGVDGIVFAQKPNRSAGETQADRYSLEKKISKVEYRYNKSFPKEGGLFAHDLAGEKVIDERGVAREDIPNYIGKDAARKLLSTEKDGGDGTAKMELTGEALVVGGEGLKRLYDTQLTAMLESYAKSKFADGVLPITDKTPGSFPLFSIKGATSALRENFKHPTTEAFKKWFGKSKITSNGKTHILYHGTNDTRFLQDKEYPWVFDIDRPARPDSSPFAGLGIFLGNDTIAMAHSGGNPDAVHPVYVRVENPLVITSDELARKVTDPASAKAFRKRAMEINGHDGIIIKDRGQVVAFTANQVKSARDNSGAYSRKNDDIRFSIGGPIDAAKTVAKLEKNRAAKQEKKGSITVVKKSKPDSGLLQRLLSTPEYYFEKFPAAWRVLQAALGRRDMRFENEQAMLGNYVKEMQALRKSNRAAYDEANDYIVSTDQAGTGFSIKEAGDGSWTVKNGFTKKDAGSFATETEAIAGMIKAEGAYLAENGFSKEAIGAIKRAREVTNHGFNIMAEDMRRIIREAKENGLPDPYIGDGKLDESGRFGVYAAGRKQPVALYASREEAEEGLARAAEMIAYTVIDAKGGEHPFMTELRAKAWVRKHGGTVKGKKFFQNLVVRERSNADLRPLTVKEALAQMGELRGTYFPRIRESGEYILIARKEGENPIRKHYDIMGAGLSEDDKDAIKKGKELGVVGKAWNLATPMGREADRLAKLGYDVKFKRDESPSEDMFAATNLVTAVDSILQESLKVTNLNDEANVQQAQTMNRIITMQVADLFKARGFLSSRMKRLQGDDVWEGYETDMTKAVTRYATGVAAGTAKRDTARAMILAFTGKDYTWQQYKEEVDKPDFAEWQAIVEARRIDPGKQKNLYGDVRNFIIDVLRNDERTDRVIGVLRGVASLKFLAFRLSSAAINATNMVQGVPATMAGHLKVSLHKAMGYVTAAAVDYGKYRSGKGVLPDADREIFVEISARGWDEAQFNYEAEKELRGKGGEAWNWIMTKGMFMFGAVEKANRAMTIYAAYKAAYQQAKKNGTSTDRDHLLDIAHEVSNRAHGTYGKETLPAWTRGETARFLRLPYTFMKFTHNYLLNMWDLGVNRREYAAAAHLLLAPGVLGGAGATLATPLLATLAGALGIGGDDPEEEFYAWVEDMLGSDRLVRHGLAGLAGVNIKGSLQIHSPMPTKLSELAGAPGAIFTDLAKGVRHLTMGEISKGVESILPTAIGSMFRSVREGTEGVTTGTYGTVFYGNEPLKADATDSFLRFLSFNPAKTSGIREKQWKERKVAQDCQEEKREIYAVIKRHVADGQGVTPEDMKAILKFNERVVGTGRPDIRPITAESLRLMLRMNVRPSKLERSRAVAE